MSAGPPYGVVAEFADAEAITSAVRAAVAAGWARMEAYAPFPVPEAAEALGVRAGLVGWIAAGVGLAGAATAFAAQWWLAVHDYPLNIGGRPPFAWPDADRRSRIVFITRGVGRAPIEAGMTAALANAAHSLLTDA